MNLKSTTDPQHVEVAGTTTAASAAPTAACGWARCRRRSARRTRRWWSRQPRRAVGRSLISDSFTNSAQPIWLGCFFTHPTFWLIPAPRFINVTPRKSIIKLQNLCHRKLRKNAAETEDTKVAASTPANSKPPFHPSPRATAEPLGVFVSAAFFSAIFGGINFEV